MEITEIKIVACESRHSRLAAFCSVVFDHQFIVRDLRIIRKGDQLFVAMPSRRVVGECPTCSGKNSLGVLFCNHCGSELTQKASSVPARDLVFNDIAHPITQEFRDHMEAQIITAYRKRKAQAG